MTETELIYLLNSAKDKILALQCKNEQLVSENTHLRGQIEALESVIQRTMGAVYDTPQQVFGEHTPDTPEMIKKFRG